MKLLVFVFMCVYLVVPFRADATPGGGDFAFVVGNSKYEGTKALSNPVNDADMIAKTFEDLGFDVSLHYDLTQYEFVQALKAFRRKSRNAERTVVYYAGHGMEFDGRNYIIPIDAAMESDLDVDFEAIELDFLVANTPASSVQVIILDACRDNPFYSTIERSTRSTAGRGLARVEPTGNTLIAYAAKEGTVALDGEGENSPYALALSSALTQPGLDIGKVFREVRASVLTKTSWKQEPVTYGSLPPEDVFFNPPLPEPEPEPEVEPEPELDMTALIQTQPATPSLPLTMDTRAQVEMEFWRSISNRGTLRDYEIYLAQFPNGIFAAVAQLRIDEFKASIAQQQAALASASQNSTARTSIVEDSVQSEEPIPETPSLALLDPEIENIEDETPLELEADPAPEEPVEAEAEPAPEEPEAEPKPTFVPTVQMVQRELDRLGCEPGTADGVWGGRSSNAFRSFLRASGRLGELDPNTYLSPEAFVALQGASSGICDSLCGRDQVLRNGQCVAVSRPRTTVTSAPTVRCRSGQVLRGGVCVTVNRPTVTAKPAPRTAQTSSSKKGTEQVPGDGATDARGNRGIFRQRGF